MEPVIREENKIYAVGYSYEADWRRLYRVKDRAAYWSRVDFSNMDKAAICLQFLYSVMDCLVITVGKGSFVSLILGSESGQAGIYAGNHLTV